MRSRQIFYAQPEPGRKASNRYSSLLRELDRRKEGAAAIPVAVGLSSALVLYFLKMKQLNDEICLRNQKVKELESIRAETAVFPSQPNYASQGSVDSFIASVRKEEAKELREQVSASDLLITEMESENPGHSFVRDSGLITAAFAAAMILGIFALKGLAAREEREASLAKKSEGPRAPQGTGAAQPARERKIAQEMEDIAHAQTCIPAPAAPPKEEAPNERFPKPDYYDKLFQELKKSIREEMGSLGSDEATEAFLRVMGPKEIEELINWPETMPVHIENNREALREFFGEKGIDPGRLFARLGPEVTQLF